jgi:Secretion system C-terminal sorting domain
MKDKDGSFTYSRSVIINSKLKETLTIFPNPTTNTLTLTHAEVKANTVVQIFTVEGKKMLEQQLSIGTTQTAMDVSKILAGNYILVINNGTATKTLAFVKQ